MAKYSWGEITKEDVEKAIIIFDSENPEYPEPKTTFLLYNGKKYPAKHIRGMAYQVHFGKEISKSEYTGGKETVHFFEKLGFEMQYTPRSVNTHPGMTSKRGTPRNELNETAVLQSGSETVSMIKKPEFTPLFGGEKISIPVKDVIEQKNALQLLLNKLCEGDIVCEKTFSWMRTPSEISGEYQSLYDNLSEYRGKKGFAKKNVNLRCDFVCEGRKLIIEYDERQHFSEARRISLLSYPNVRLNYDRDLWIRACRDIQAKDNQPEDRDEARAFYDSIRDIESAKNGYTLVRIMHGQIDFEKPDAEEMLKEILGIANENKDISLSKEKNIDKKDDIRTPLKIGLYLQTDEVCNDIKFYEAMDAVRNSDIDILVFPEFAYTPFINQLHDADYLNYSDVQELFDKALELSQDIGRAVVFCNKDRFQTIMSIFANAFASEGETKCKDYIKHTMTDFSACEVENYPEYAEYAFQPILFKGYRIGMTICYDCNHSMFSRKYGKNGVDIILNSTGGDVLFDKWHKYNKVRSIENGCFSFVTMGGPGNQKNPHNYVYGFTPTGKEMHPVLLNGEDRGNRNCSGGIYVYDMAEDDGMAENDSSINQCETVNKKNDLLIPSSNIPFFINTGRILCDGIRILEQGDNNIVMCIVKGADIVKPEKVLKLLYEKELRNIPNKRYIIINPWEKIDMDFYRTQLSVILKVRAMENYCAVLLTAGSFNKCFQTGCSRTAQVVREKDGYFGIDLSRTGGPEIIWKNKQGMKASWRKNIEWLIDSM